MVRGLLSGVAVGAIVSVLGLGAVSLMFPVGDMAAKPVAQTAPAPLPAPPLAQLRQSDAAEPQPAAMPAPSVPDHSPVILPPKPDDSGVSGGFGQTLLETSPGRHDAPLPAPAATAPASDAPSSLDERAFTDPAARPSLAQQAPEVAALASEDQSAPNPETIEQIPVPPPGEAVAPDLPPVEDMAEKPAQLPQASDEIVLLPDGSQVLPNGSVQKPRVFGAGEGVGLKADPDVPTDRLPRIGAAPAAQPAVSEPPEEPAWKRYAAPFSAAPGQSLFSVVLVDAGIAKGGLDQDTLLSLGFPVTIALDPARADAGAVARAYQAAGLEVAILMQGLPDNPTQQDLDTAMESWRAAVPGAIALVEPATPVIQNNRQLSQHLLALAERDGLAVITQDKGSNAADQLARNADWPEAKIWRVLDDGRERATRIARELVRAEFEAKRDGKAVVMLTAWPESVAGLRDWAEGAHDGVVLAPVSAGFEAE